MGRARYGRPARHLPSEMLVLGCRAAAAPLMKRPVVAERYPDALLGTVCTTLVRGDLATVLALTNRPVAALRATRLPMKLTSLHVAPLFAPVGAHRT